MALLIKKYVSKMDLQTLQYIMNDFDTESDALKLLQHLIHIYPNLQHVMFVIKSYTEYGVYIESYAKRWFNLFY